MLNKLGLGLARLVYTLRLVIGLMLRGLDCVNQDEIKEEEGDDENGGKKNVCEECGVSFKKPAHLKQHMQSHSLEGDFVEGDDQFRSRPRGGLKRKLPVKINTLMRKRVCPPSECDELHGSDYVSWLLSTEDED
ncbi:putative transcription factor C2H2 family [Helianthus anomalus]